MRSIIQGLGVAVATSGILSAAACTSDKGTAPSVVRTAVPAAADEAGTIPGVITLAGGDGQTYTLDVLSRSITRTDGARVIFDDTTTLLMQQVFTAMAIADTQVVALDAAIADANSCDYLPPEDPRCVQPYLRVSDGPTCHSAGHATDRRCVALEAAPFDQPKGRPSASRAPNEATPGVTRLKTPVLARLFGNPCTEIVNMAALGSGAYHWRRPAYLPALFSWAMTNGVSSYGGFVVGSILTSLATTFDVQLWDMVGAAVQVGLYAGQWKDYGCTDGIHATVRLLKVSREVAAAHALAISGGTSAVFSYMCHRDRKYINVAGSLFWYDVEVCDPVYYE